MNNDESSGAATPADKQSRWLEHVDNITQSTWKGKRAPEKPMLLLYALAQLQQDHQSRVSFEHAVVPLQHLLRDFGRPGGMARPEYPFQHLLNDGLWVLDTDEGRATELGGVKNRVSRRRLIDRNAIGRLDPTFEAALLSEPGLLVRVAQHLLDANWTESLHADICAGVGLRMETEVESVTESGRTTVSRRKRDPKFRHHVLLAYEHRCAVCGWGGRLDAAPVGLEAAHLMWHTAGGPDETPNGLCLCVMHHKLLDRGAIAVTDDLTVAVSEHFLSGGGMSESLVLGFNGRPINRPQRDEYEPNPEFLAWHREEVFQAPARVVR